MRSSAASFAGPLFRGDDELAELEMELLELRRRGGESRRPRFVGGERLRRGLAGPLRRSCLGDGERRLRGGGERDLRLLPMLPLAFFTGSGRRSGDSDTSELLLRRLRGGDRDREVECELSRLRRLVGGVRERLDDVRPYEGEGRRRVEFDGMYESIRGGGLP